MPRPPDSSTGMAGLLSILERGLARVPNLGWSSMAERHRLADAWLAQLAGPRPCEPWS